MPDYIPRRRWSRQPVTVDCRIEGISARASLRVSELSFGGGYVDTVAVFSPGSPVTVVMVLDGEEAAVSGRVVYTHPGMGFGFAFNLEDTLEPSRQRIVEFLKQQGGSAEPTDGG